MGVSWQRGILVLGLATQVGAQGSPSLSMAGMQRVDAGAAPVSISRRGLSEDQVRKEVIRRLEARIQARRQAEQAEATTRAKVDSAREELAPDASQRLGELQAAVRRANQLPSARPAAP